MFSKIDNEYGDIVISSTVIANIAGIVANNCYGVVGMAFKNKKDGIVSLLKPSNMSKGIGVSIEDNEINITLHIIVQYGVNINAICQSIMHNVEYQVEKMIGFPVKNIEVCVESIRSNN